MTYYLFKGVPDSQPNGSVRINLELIQPNVYFKWRIIYLKA